MKINRLTLAFFTALLGVQVLFGQMADVSLEAAFDKICI